jgi:hypothetical protein
MQGPLVAEAWIMDIALLHEFISDVVMSRGNWRFLLTNLQAQIWGVTLGKFDSKSDEGIFLGYSTNSRAYRVFNKRTETVMESINVGI